MQTGRNTGAIRSLRMLPVLGTRIGLLSLSIYSLAVSSNAGAQQLAPNPNSGVVDETSGPIINAGSFENSSAGIIYFGSGVTLSNLAGASLQNLGQLWGYSGSTLINQESGSVTNSQGASIYALGNFNNYGSISNSGTIRPYIAMSMDDGVKLIVDANAHADVAPFAWGAALAAYPYFGRVTEFTGRLIAIQGDCSVAEIHRRISEVYGDREVTKRATQAVLQTQANWGAIARVQKGKRLVRLAARGLTDQRAVAWLIEAALHYQGKAMPLATLKSAAVLYPFVLDQPLAYVITNSSALELRSEGPSQQFVALHAAI